MIPPPSSRVATTLYAKESDLYPKVVDQEQDVERLGKGCLSIDPDYVQKKRPGRLLFRRKTGLGSTPTCED
jgi:hypothetical protein